MALKRFAVFRCARVAIFADTIFVNAVLAARLAADKAVGHVAFQRLEGLLANFAERTHTGLRVVDVLGQPLTVPPLHRTVADDSATGGAGQDVADDYSKEHDKKNESNFHGME